MAAEISAFRAARAEAAAAFAAPGLAADRAVMAAILDCAARVAQGPRELQRATMAALVAAHARQLPDIIVAGATGLELSRLVERRARALAVMGEAADFARQVRRTIAAVEARVSGAAMAAMGGVAS